MKTYNKLLIVLLASLIFLCTGFATGALPLDFTESNDVSLKVSAGVGESVEDATVTINYDVVISISNYTNLVNMQGSVTADLESGVKQVTLIEVTVDAEALVGNPKANDVLDLDEDNPFQDFHDNLDPRIIEIQPLPESEQYMDPNR
jgi:hypothetical protein